MTHVHNVRYLTGFTGEDSALLVSAGEDILITDGRFCEQAGEEAPGVTIATRRRSLMAAAASRARKLGIGRLGFESGALTVAAHAALAEHARKIALKPTSGEVEGLRQVKDRNEVAAIAGAVRVAEEAFDEIRRLIRPRVTEIRLARALEAAMLCRGAQAPAFPTIVAFAERTSLPHARPTNRRLRSGEAVLLDWGACVEFYNSDLTRVLFLDTIPQSTERIYRITLAAQGAALRRIESGVSCRQLDEAARGYIARRGKGRYLRHGLGHGVGLQVHEGPGLRRGSKDVLKAGMVFTVEPGIYVPQRGGVRIEDMALVTRTGVRVLTHTPKALRAAVVRA